MVGRLIEDFSRQEVAINQQPEGNESPIARELAESNGYGYVGIRYIPLGTTYYTVLLVERRTEQDKGEVEYVAELFKKRGHPVETVTTAYKDGTPMALALITGKVYESGGTATLDRQGSLKGKPLAEIGYHNNKTIFGVFANTDGAYIPDVEWIAGLLGMLPITKEQIPSAFRDLFEELG